MSSAPTAGERRARVLTQALMIAFTHTRRAGALLVAGMAIAAIFSI